MNIGLPPDAWRLLLHGVLITLMLTAAAGLIGLLSAFALAFAQLARSRPLRIAATVHVEFWRGSSALVQLFVAFYVLPILGVSLPPFAVGSAVLGLNIGAYASQVVRAAILAVPAGQREAAMALGLNGRLSMRLVVLPQALAAMLPIFGNEAAELLKLTAATSLITLQDLSLAGREIVAQHGHETLVYSTELLIYFTLTLPLFWGAQRLEARLRMRGQGVAGEYGLQGA